MPFLVSVVRGASSDELIHRLGSIYIALATEWVRARTADSSAVGTWRDLAERIEVLDRPVDLSSLSNEPPLNLIDHGTWRAVELLNCLNHIEVLLGASEMLGRVGWRPFGTAPTQQHLDDVDDGGVRQDALPGRIADLEGEDDVGRRFALEAYGGVNYRNNSKAAHDLSALSGHPSKRLLLAARTSAFPVGWLKQGRGSRIEASCSLRHGGPYRAAAEVTQQWSDNRYTILEVAEVTVLRSRAPTL